MTTILLVVIAIELLVLLDRLGWGSRKLSWQYRLHYRIERWYYRRRGYND